VHLTALVEAPDHVCCRYRVAAFQPFLERAGHSLEIRARPKRWWEWFRLCRELRHTDAVLLQRKLLARWQLFLLRRAAGRLLFDFDDAVFLRDSYSARGFHSAGRLRGFAAVVRAADAVVAGNNFLAEQAARFAAPARVHVIPTCVDPARYPLAQHSPRPRASGRNGDCPPKERGQSPFLPDALTACSGRPLTELVWVGSSSTLQGLEAIRPMLESLGKAVPGLCLKLICDRFLDLEHLPVVPCAWSEAGEGADLASSDIGISWIPDDPWSRGKCGLKVLQYMAAALPVVANPVGVHPELVQHGVNGFLAETPAEWAEAIGELAADPALRLRMGRAGRQRLEHDYSVAAGARRWAALLDGLGQRRGVA
jgi:glycosyltransferase involved in cell wall biosynthesis